MPGKPTSRLLKVMYAAILQLSVSSKDKQCLGEIRAWAVNQWIGLREILQESSIFNRKIYGFLSFLWIFP
jgi:hypothetical protein